MTKQSTIADMSARALLRIYRTVGDVIYPFTGAILRARARRGKEDSTRRGERYGYASCARPDGPLVWLHAASVGESLAIMPLIRRFEDYGISIVLTTGTVTSANIANEKLSRHTIHQYVPLDMNRAVRRFLDHWQPDLAIFAESEIWPTTIRELSDRRVPQILVNARMSDRSDRRWSRRQSLASAIFRQLALVVAQSDLDGERFRKLGAPWVKVAGNLKIDVGIPEADPAETTRLRAMIGRRPAWLAVSTHEGEEESIAEVHRILAEHEPRILTILVPRHPDRSEAITGQLQDFGLDIATRSSGAAIAENTQLFLGDTIGEMGLYLRLADIAFMGKSLGAQGGQNPIEPALIGAAILSGRYVQNFRDTYQALLDAGGARLVKDERMLAGHVLHLLRNEADREAMKTAARSVVDDMGGALESTLHALDPYIMPLRVKAGLARSRIGMLTNGRTAGNE